MVSEAIVAFVDESRKNKHLGWQEFEGETFCQQWGSLLEPIKTGFDVV